MVLGGDVRPLGCGLGLAALLVPQGMAYAELAGVPPVTGLYATLVPLIVYLAETGVVWVDWDRPALTDR